MKVVEMDDRVKDAPSNRARRGEFFSKLPREYVPQRPRRNVGMLIDLVGFGATVTVVTLLYFALRGCR
jgi:hypothetical protein